MQLNAMAIKSHTENFGKRDSDIYSMNRKKETTNYDNKNETGDRKG